MSILLVMIAGIGDLILASRSFRAMRKAYPQARIDLITSSDSTPIAKRYPYLDKIWSFPIRELRSNKWMLVEILSLINSLRKTEYNMIVNLHPVASFSGSCNMAMLFALLRGQKKFSHRPYKYLPIARYAIPNSKFKDQHYSDAYLNVAKVVGGIADAKGIEVFYNPSVEESVSSKILSKIGNQNKIVGINPGSDQPKKRLPIATFAAIADHLIKVHSVNIVILGGPGEVHISHEIEQKMKKPAINLAGKLSLEELTCLINCFDLLITNDSAPMHIAAALNIKQVAIFGPGFPDRFRPYTSIKNYKLIYKKLSCRPCARKVCDDLSCVKSITIDEVVNATEELLFQ